MIFAFLSIASVVVGKSLGDALLLTTCDLGSVPLFFIVSSLALMVVSLVQFALLRIIRPAKLNTIVIALFAALTTYFYFISDTDSVAVSLTVSSSLIVFPSLLNIICWNTISDYFDLRQGRRLFSLIFAASTFGGVVSGVLLPPFIHAWGVEKLFFVEVAAFLLTIPATVILSLKRKREKTQLSFSDEQKVSLQQNLRDGLSSFWQIPLLRILAIVVFLGAISTNFIDFGLKAFLQSHYNRQEIGLFYGYFNAASNTINLLFQILVASTFLRRFKLENLFRAVPCILLMLAVPAVFWPAFAIVVLLRFMDQFLRFTLQDAAREIAMAPIAFIERNRAKFMIKGFMNPFGAIVAGVLLYVFQLLPGLPVRTPFIILVLVLVLWLVSLRKINVAYSDCLYHSLLSSGTPSIRVNSGELEVCSASKPDSSSGISEHIENDELVAELLDDSPKVRLNILEQMAVHSSFSESGSGEDGEVTSESRQKWKDSELSELFGQLLERELAVAEALIFYQVRLNEFISEDSDNNRILTRCSDDLFEFYISTTYRILIIVSLMEHDGQLFAAARAIVSHHSRMRAQAFDLFEMKLKKHPDYPRMAIFLDDLSSGERLRRLNALPGHQMLSAQAYLDILSKENDLAIQNAVKCLLK